MAGTVTFNDREWKDLITKINSKIRDPRPLLKTAFSVRGFKDVMDHFKKEEGPQSKWKRSIRAEEQGGQTLQDTGNLRNNFLPGNIENKGSKGIVFFNPTPYAIYHDEGTGRLPQREFMWLSDDAQEDMLEIILDAII